MGFRTGSPDDEAILQAIESPPVELPVSGQQDLSSESEADKESNDYDSGEWQWPPPASATETSFIETSDVKEPLSGDYKVICCKHFF